MSRESKLIKNTMIIAIGNICTKCISFFMLPFYTSLLSTEEYGTVDLISTYVAFLSAILTLQFEQGVFRYLIEVRTDKDKQVRYISTAMLSVICVAAIFVLILTPILLALQYRYWAQLIGWVAVAVLNSLLLQLPRGLGKNTVYAAASCISGSLNVILNVIFIAVLHWSVNGMLIASIISLAMSGVYIFFRLKVFNYVKISCYDKSNLIELLKYSVPLIPNTLCWWVVNVSDRVVIRIFLGEAANGIYSAACKFPSLFSMISNIFQLSWTESASENIEDKDKAIFFGKIINQATRFYSSCNMGFIAILPFVFHILIKNDFTEAYWYIPILMTGALFHAVADLYGSIYTALKETKNIAKTTVLSAVVNIVINVIFIAKIGLFAASISTFIAYLVITVIRYIDIKKRIGVKLYIKYFLIELFIYIVVFASYYSGNRLFQICALIVTVPYCVFQNREVITGMANNVKKKLKRL